MPTVFTAVERRVARLALTADCDRSRVSCILLLHVSNEFVSITRFASLLQGSQRSAATTAAPIARVPTDDGLPDVPLVAALDAMSPVRRPDASTLRTARSIRSATSAR